MRKTLSFPSSHLRPRRPARRAVHIVASAGLAATLAVALLPILSGDSAAAQSPQCGAREAVLDRLSAKYEEQPVSLGITATGSLLEVLASPGGSWTIIVTLPGGPTCLVSSGEGWRMAPVQVAQDPAV
jgi:hypothetical protein